MGDITLTGTINAGRAIFSSTHADFYGKVRNDDPSILPEAGKPFNFRRMDEGEGIELFDALLENKSVTYLEVQTAIQMYTKRTAEVMAKYLRTSKCFDYQSSLKICYAVFCLHFKRVRRSRD
jgi:hypothetical protein